MSAIITPTAAGSVQPALTTAPVNVPRLSEIIHRLGDIPLERILFHPYPGTATDQDVIDCEAKTGLLCELVDGVLVEKAVGYYEDRLGVVLGGLIDAHAFAHLLGIVLGSAGMIRTDPSQVRMPDVAFVSWDHFPGKVLPPGAILELSPDLAVEILSPSNTAAEMDRKRREDFANGTQLVWQVYPPTRRVRVYTAVDQYAELDETGTLDGGSVLPGFSLSIRAWFERAGRRATT